MFHLLTTWFGGLVHFYFFSCDLFVGPKYCAKKKSVHTQKPSANGGQCGAGVGSERTAEGPVEHAYYKMMDTLRAFKNIRAVEEVLCPEGEDGELDIHI